MPEITVETPREAYTIAGEAFNIFQPYTEGHVLTVGEASSLNQTFAENIRNNFAAKVKEAKEAGSFDREVFQGNLDDYMAEYEFGLRRGGGGGRTGDPVEAEAMLIARQKVREAIVKKGHALKDVPASEITRLAKDALAGPKGDLIRELARQRVEAQRELTDIDVGEVRTEEPTAADESTSGRKRKAAGE